MSVVYFVVYDTQAAKAIAEVEAFTGMECRNVGGVARGMKDLAVVIKARYPERVPIERYMNDMNQGAIRGMSVTFSKVEAHDQAKLLAGSKEVS
jgi:hypothetical protein